MQGDQHTLPGGMRVLLVEDEPLIAMDAEAILLSLGVERIVWARGVDEALHTIEAAAFHAAILDLRLGREETSLPLAHRLDELRVPYGFLTGYLDDDIPAAFRRRPIVPKPFTADQLLQLMLRLTSRSR